MQVVNIAPHRQDVSVFLHNMTWGAVSLAAKQTVIAGPTPQAENSFQDPHLVRAAFTASMGERALCSCRRGTFVAVMACDISRSAVLALTTADV